MWPSRLLRNLSPNSKLSYLQSHFYFEMSVTPEPSDVESVAIEENETVHFDDVPLEEPTSNKDAHAPTSPLENSMRMFAHTLKETLGPKAWRTMFGAEFDSETYPGEVKEAITRLSALRSSFGELEVSLKRYYALLDHMSDVEVQLSQQFLQQGFIESKL
jgi:hypothetical protein